ncbi:MAG: hypothetical protein M5U08_18520 [Burkholderiales bacterium]|nr:hypothetical protein [Burkholderiales bacterium]
MERLADKRFTLPPERLAEMVAEAHERTLGCIADLHDAQLEVPLLEVVNPFRWGARPLRVLLRRVRAALARRAAAADHGPGR